MFFSTAIPGILHAESLRVVPIHTDKIEKVRACMTVEETANQQRGVALPSDMILLKELVTRYCVPGKSLTGVSLMQQPAQDCGSMSRL